jgi:hypothetical protein
VSTARGPSTRDDLVVPLENELHWHDDSRGRLHQGLIARHAKDCGRDRGSATIRVGLRAPRIQTGAFAGSDQTVFTGMSLPPGQHTITVTDVSGELAVGSFQVPAQPYLNVSGAWGQNSSPATTARLRPSRR